MLCLSCWRMSPPAARYCGHCGRSFRGRYCTRGHRSPRWARRCLECGDARLTTPTPYVPSGWLYRGLSWLVLLLLVRWAFSHGSLVGRGVSGMARWTLSNVFGVAPADLAAWLSHLLTLALISGIVLAALPGHFGRRIRYLALGTGRILCAALARIIPAAGRWLHGAVRGGRPRP